MADSFFYARLKTYNPKKGFGFVRYHFAGNLFQGGDRPVWYKVSPDLANLCRKDTQESGVLSFDVVTAEEKLEIDSVEENRRLIALGLMSATMVAPRGPQMVDITAREDRESVPTRGSARSEALPESSTQSTIRQNSEGVLSTNEFGIAAK